MLYLLLHGLFQSKNIKNIRDFNSNDGFVSVGWLVISIYSVYIPVFAIETIDKISDFPVFCLIALLTPFAWKILECLYANKIEKFQQYSSIAEIFHHYYGLVGLIFGGFSLIISSVIFIAIYIIILGYSLHYCSNFDLEYAIFISTVLISTYSIVSISRTDIISRALQYTLMCIALPLILAIFAKQFGGLGEMLIHPPKDDIAQEEHSMGVLVIGYIIFAFVSKLTAPLVQGYILSSNTLQITKIFKRLCMMDFAISIILVIFSWLISICSHHDTYHFVANIVNTPSLIALKMLVLLGIFSFCLGNSKAYFNVAAGFISQHALQLFFKKHQEKVEVFAVRTSMLLISVMTYYAIHLSQASLISLLWAGLSIYGAVFFPSLIFMLAEFQIPRMVFIISSVSGVFGIWVGYLIEQKIHSASLIISTLSSFVILSIGNILNPPIKTKSANATVKSKRFESLRRISNIIRFTVNIRTPDIMLFCKEGIEKCSPKPWHLFLVTILSLFSYIIMSENLLADTHTWFIEITIRSITAFTCMLFAFNNVMDKHDKNPALPLYWNMILLFALPVSGIFSYLSHGSLAEFIIRIFALSAFADYVRFIALSALGSIVGIALFLFISTSFVVDASSFSTIEFTIFYPLFSYILCILMRYMHDSELAVLQIFSGALAHEVKSPMASMSMNIETLGSILNSSVFMSADKVSWGDFSVAVSRDESYVAIIPKEDVDMLHQVMENMQTALTRGIRSSNAVLMAVSRGANAPDIRTHSVKSTIIASIEDYGLTAERRKAITVKGGDFLFYGSSMLFKHVLYNLLGNAIKHGGSNVKIEIRLENRRLYFKDNGRGISPEKLSKVFDLFYTQEIGGSGLGLALCRSIMFSLGGEITCSSELGKYTEFVLSFPAVHGEVEEQ